MLKNELKKASLFSKRSVNKKPPDSLSQELRQITRHFLRPRFLAPHTLLPCQRSTPAIDALVQPTLAACIRA